MSRTTSGAHIFVPQPSLAQLQKTAEFLTANTQLNWSVHGRELHVDQVILADSWGQAQEQLAQRLRALGIESFNCIATQRGQGEGRVSIHAEIRDSQQILTIADKATRISRGFFVPLSEAGLAPNTLQSAAVVLQIQTGLPWMVVGNTLQYSYSFPPISNWEQEEKAFRHLMLTQTGMTDLSVLASNRNYKLLAIIDKQFQINRLAQLHHPQLILLDARSMPRSLASIAATLCIVSQGYTKEEINQQGPNPDSRLPFPMLEWVDEGLSIKFPRELVEEHNVVGPLETVVSVKARSIRESRFGRTFIAQVIIPWDQVKSFIEKDLGLNTVTYPDGKVVPIMQDIIAAKQGVPFTPTQIRSLLESGGAGAASSSGSGSSEVRIVELRALDPQLISKAKEIWPRKVASLESGTSPPENKIFCLVQGNNLLGLLSLNKMDAAYVASVPMTMSTSVGRGDIYSMDMEIAHGFRGQGYGRQLFEAACESVTRAGNAVFFADETGSAVGDVLYGGIKTRKKFDVQIEIRGNRGHQYFLMMKKREQDIPEYVKIDLAQNSHIPYLAVEKPEGLRHLTNYIIAHPEDKIYCIGAVEMALARRGTALDFFDTQYWNSLKALHNLLRRS